MTEASDCSVTLTLDSNGKLPTASLHGELDASCAASIEQLLVDVFAPHRIGCVDLRNLGFVDVVGARSLHSAVQRLAEGGTRIRLKHVSPWQRRLFTWCGWEYLLDGSEYPRRDPLSRPDPVP